MFLRRKQQQASSDEELVVAIKAGRSEALGVLWDRYAHLLFAVGMKYLKDVEAAKDAVMNVFTDLPSLMARHEVRNAGAWLHTVMRNHCLMQLRGARQHTELNGTQYDEADELLAAHLENEEMIRRMEKAIDELNDHQRNCIKLFYLDRLSYAEVGERLDMAFDAVRSNIQNGRRNLRIIIERGNAPNAT